MVGPVPVRPGGVRGRAVPGPQDLRIRPDERIGPPPLLLHPAAAIDQLIIAPSVGDDQGIALDGGGHRKIRRRANSGRPEVSSRKACASSPAGPQDEPVRSRVFACLYPKLGKAYPKYFICIKIPISESSACPPA